jgi:D-sedoheptulose 7-phosphate isomerase
MSENVPSIDLVARINQHFTESANLKLDAVKALADPLRRAAERMVQCLMNEGKIMACGNGGSAADAQHFTAELLNRFEMDRPGLAAFALTTDASTVTSIANDFDFEQVFSKQVRALGQPADVLLAISTSGKSPNVLKAARSAKALGMRVIALTGKAGAPLDALADIVICTPGGAYADRAQELHIKVIHILIELIERELFPGNYK